MKERQWKLLALLVVNSNTLFQIDGLRKELACSEKTVRNDLHRLEVFLEAYPEARLIRKPGMGVMLEVDEDTQAEIYQHVYRVTEGTEEERMIETAYHLLVSAKPVTLTALADKYFTTPAAMKQDLARIEKWLAPFRLTMTTKQRVGTTVEGKELHKRNALAHLSELVTSPEHRNYVLDFFPEHEVATVKKIIKDVQRAYDFELNDGRSESLVIHALIMMKRTRQGTPVLVSDIDAGKTIQTKEYKITADLLERLEKILGLTFPMNERIYYTWHLTSSIQQIDDQKLSMEERLASGVSGKITKKMIDKVQQLTRFQFAGDEVLVDGLVIHLEAAVKRMSYGFHIANPMLQDIKKLYPYLFSMVVFAAHDISEQYDLHITEEEAAYLVLHFQASVERMEKQREPQRVLVVCHMGLGMSRLLQAKLEQQYKELSIIDCIAANELTDFLKQEEIDFIISTVPLRAGDIPHLVISPLLNAEDKGKLEQFIQADQAPETVKQYPTLYHFIKNGLFQRNLAMEHPFQVVERLSEQLVHLQLVEEAFTHSALIRERTSYTAIGGAIAIPHAKPATVRQSTVSMAILKEAMEWGSEQVSIVFLLAINEEDLEVTEDLLKEISNLSEDPPFIEKLLEVKNKQEVETLFYQSID